MSRVRPGMLESGSGFDDEASCVCLWRGAARRGRGAKVVARCASRTNKKLVAGLRRRVGGAICAAAAAWRCVVSLQGWLRESLWTTLERSREGGCLRCV